MAASVDGKCSGGNVSSKMTLDAKFKVITGGAATRSSSVPMSLKNLKADLMAASNSTSSPSLPSSNTSRVEERLESQQFTGRKNSNVQQRYQQEEEKESRRNLSGPLHSLPPLWTEGFAKGVTTSVKRSVDDIISRGNLLHAPKRKFWSSLSPEDILRPSSHGLGGSEDEEEEYILGSGSFSKVTKVYIKQKDGNSQFALKHLKGDLLPSKLTENSCKNGSVIAFTKAATELAREAFLLSQFDHPHIINILGWTGGGVNSYSTYRRHDAYFLVLELLQEETLDDRIERWNQDDEHLQTFSCTEQKRKAHFHQRKVEQLTICRQIASALAYIHSKNVVYRDLKPQNIGFARGIDNEDFDCEGSVVVKLMDFGLARELPSSGSLQSFSAFQQHGHNRLLFDMTGTVGTIRYMAPEVCMNRPYGLECDIYSWSIVAHEILSQTKPYGDMTPDMYQSLVCQQGVRPPAQNMPSEHIVLLTKAWRTDPSKRLPFKRIKRQLDLFLQQEKLIWEAQELLSEMPDKRESPIVLSESFAEENFGIHQDSSSLRGVRRGNKRSWYRANHDGSLPDRDSRNNPIFPNASEDYHREHHTPTEYRHDHPHGYNYDNGTAPRNVPVYQESPPPSQSHYEGTRSLTPPRRRPQPVTPDRHWNRPKKRRHERAHHNYYPRNDYIRNHHGGYHNRNPHDNYDHSYGNHHRGSENRHRQVSPRNAPHEYWGNAYY